MKKIKVAFLAHDYNLKTGGNRSLLNLIDEIKKCDVECLIFVPQEGEFSQALQERSLPYVIVPSLFWMFGFRQGESSLRITARRYKKIGKRILYGLKYFRHYIKQIKQWQPDLLYTNTTAIFEGALLAWWLRLPHVWHIRELKGLEFKYDLGDTVFKFLFRQADAQIFVSYALKNALSGYYDPAKAYVVHNGVPLPKTAIAERKYEDYTFAMVGRLQARKNPQEAIEALSYVRNTYPKVRLLLAGGGTPSYVASLKELVNQYALENNIVFIGEVEDPHTAVYSQADAYLMCSTNETFGRVTVEAMLAKLPVIGYKSEITGTKEIVEDGVTGLLYEGGAPALAACMEKFIQNPIWAQQLGQKGYNVAIRKFSVETYAAHIYRIIQAQVKHP